MLSKFMSNALAALTLATLTLEHTTAELVFDEAENRLHAQKAIMARRMGV